MSTWQVLCMALALGGLLPTAAMGAPASPATAGASMVEPLVGDAMPQPLTAHAGDAQRGRAIVAQRQLGLCLLCHQAPIAEEPQQGNLSSDLAGAGSRWTAAQLRLRVVDARRLNPDSLMPAFHRTQGLTRVGAAWAGKPVLDAQQVEDVVAYLVSLK